MSIWLDHVTNETNVITQYQRISLQFLVFKFIEYYWSSSHRLNYLEELLNNAYWGLVWLWKITWIDIRISIDCFVSLRKQRTEVCPCNDGVYPKYAFIRNLSGPDGSAFEANLTTVVGWVSRKPLKSWPVLNLLSKYSTEYAKVSRPISCWIFSFEGIFHRVQFIHSFRLSSRIRLTFVFVFHLKPHRISAMYCLL